jgi:hypothetical protein
MKQKIKLIEPQELKNSKAGFTTINQEWGTYRDL